MKTVCSIYFSPTGNTKGIIEGFLLGQNEINHISFDITLLPERLRLAESIDSLNVKPDYWIIGCPVYSGYAPNLVIEQIKKLNGQNIPTVVLVTYGNKSYGSSLNQLYNELEQLNFNIIGMGAFIGEHSYSEKFNIAKNRPDEYDLKVANEYGKKIFNLKQLKPLKTSINGKVDFVARLMPNGGPKPFVKSELCINCLLCVENCPKNLIDARTKMFKNTMSNEECLSCMSCVKKCPVNARGYNISKPVEYFLDKVYFNKSRKVRKEPFII